MAIPRRLQRQTGRTALVDGIPFRLPVDSQQTPALMAAFPIDATRAARMLPDNELHPLRFRGRGVLLITVVDYRVTDIGKYIEYSIAIACTRGRRPVAWPLAALRPRHYGLGQYVHDLPVSTEVSVKGGKGIWGMPKHRASLDFLVGDEIVSSQYDLDGQMVMRIDVERPARAWLPLNVGAVNYCQFRGMLMKSYIYFRGRLGFSLLRRDSARIALGDHPRARALRDLQISPEPLFSGFLPDTTGVLDDHMESWFISHAQLPVIRPEGLESVVDLGQGQEWPEPPRREGMVIPTTPREGALP